MNEIKDETKEKENNAVQTIDQKEIEQENKELDFPKNNNIKIDLILILIAIIVITLALCSTMFAVINRKSSKIVKGVSISNIDVSNLTKEEAIKKLEEVYGSKSEKKIYLSYGEFDSSITYEALEVRYQIENAIKQAYDVGREGNIFQENFEILKTWYKNININIEVTIDNDMIDQIAQNINNSIDGAVVQPSYYVENDNSKLIITSGKEGVKVDEKKLLEEIYKVLDENTDD